MWVIWCSAGILAEYNNPWLGMGVPTCALMNMRESHAQPMLDFQWPGTVARSQIVRYILALFFGAVSLPALSQDLEAEVIQHVIDPCYTQSLTNAGIGEHIGIEQAVRLLKLSEPENTAMMVNSMLEIVRTGMTPEDRMTIYKLGRAMCVEGMAEGLNDQIRDTP